jgi:hypothetical protein
MRLFVNVSLAAELLHASESWEDQDRRLQLSAAALTAPHLRTLHRAEDSRSVIVGGDLVAHLAALPVIFSAQIEPTDIASVTRGDAKIDYRRHARACERYNRFSRHLPSPIISRPSQEDTACD